MKTYFLLDIAVEVGLLCVAGLRRLARLRVRERAAVLATPHRIQPFYSQLPPQCRLFPVQPVGTSYI